MNIPNEISAANQPKMTVDEHNNIIAQLNPDKILADNKNKQIEAVMESMSNDRAAREPLPGPTNNAFINEPLFVETTIGNVTIRPMVAFDINIFKLINSPFYKLLMGDISAANDQMPFFTSEEESYELIYQFTHPIKEVYQLFKKGSEQFRDRVFEEVAFIYSPKEAANLVEKIMLHVFNVNMARVGFDAPEPPPQDTVSGTGESAGSAGGDKKKQTPVANINTPSSLANPVGSDGTVI